MSRGLGVNGWRCTFPIVSAKAGHDKATGAVAPVTEHSRSMEGRR